MLVEGPAVAAAIEGGKDDDKQPVATFCVTTANEPENDSDTYPL
jgi:hypothetical protein